jgi:arylsulfatase A-like enzyme
MAVDPSISTDTLDAAGSGPAFSPLYQQIKSLLLQSLQSGEWKSGAAIPSELDLAARYRVSQGTVRKAIDELAVENLLVRRQGKGTFVATHAEDQNPKQYLPQPASMSLYRDVTVPVPATATDAAFRALPPFLANARNEGRDRWTWRFDTPERYQEYMKNYYRLATEVDATCGRVLDELRTQGVLDRTLVIFTTDNGYFHGEHGLADKWYPYEESIRVPLIVWDPRMPAAKRGTTDDARTLNVDLAPTILAAAHIAAPAAMQGRDLAPLYLDPHPPAWRSEFLYEHPMLTSRDFIPGYNRA